MANKYNCSLDYVQLEKGLQETGWYVIMIEASKDKWCRDNH